MKKFISAIVTCMALLFGCVLFAYGAGSGYVDGSTVVYTFEDVPAGNMSAFTVYLFTNKAKIKCYGSASTRSPQAINGSAVNKYNMTPAINKGTVVSKGALKATAPGGSAVKAAEKVSFSYTYKGGEFSATVSIQSPSSSLTGLAFVGRDGKSHYYSIGGTIDISSLVKQAARNAAGPGGSSGGTGAGGTGSGSESSSGSGGSAGTGGSGTGSGSGGGDIDPGSGGSGSPGGSGAGTGADSGEPDEDEDVTISDHAQDKTDIRDSITEITSPDTSSDPDKNNSRDDKPPCVLRRIWG